MKRVVCLLLSLVLLLGLLPTALAADGEGTGEKLEYGEPVGFTVEIEGEKRICFMGVGQLINGKYNLLSETTMGWSKNQFGALHVAVGLWWLKDFGGGNYDWIALTSDEVDAVTKQVGPFSLEISPDSGQGTTPDAQNETDASAPKMPCQCFYKLQKQHEGKWILKASCTVNGIERPAYGAATLTVTEDSNYIELSDFETVKDINDKLKTEINKITEPGKYNIAVLLSKTGETEDDAYCGRIEIPNIQKDGISIWVEIRGVGTVPATLFGGIYSDTIPFSAARINFKGAGKEYETWPEDGPNAGKLNVAFDGNSESNLSNCTFTGYDIAIKCGTSLRMFGRYNTFTENHIAWKLSEACKGDGNPDAQSCVFEENDYALYVENFNGFPSNYAPRYCRFIDNGYDVYNGSGRWWFLPGNYFEHEKDRKIVYDTSADATPVFCYPMAIREGTNGQEENNPVTYYYDQLEDGGDTVSNALTSTYQTPADKLDGKTFKVADAEKDNILATFSFDDTAAEQAEEKPVRPVLRARMLRSAVEPSFDATVSVDRSDASKIVFHMEDPCKRVTVSLPCEFKDGTVKLGQTEILDAKFDGQTVSFQTKKAGTYVIESKTPVQPKPDDAINGIISSIVASGALQPGASASQFADLTSGSWYYGGVRYALENGLMTGTSARTFAPDRPVTRAMLVTILWRLAGEPYGRVSPFEDVLPGSWYAQAVSWAYDKGIVTGVTATSFQPGAPVTREQLCAILCRYAALTGKNTAASASLDAFTDRAQVSAYAEASVRWALQAGLLTGVGDGRLAPRSGATRAQLAVLLQRFAGLK
ncbi:MAG: S-layer homology domain-containing protein [Clostridiales bacterium]|nr:S-layer homology domain-containing protein [Clostridiales bacterium]